MYKEPDAHPEGVPIVDARSTKHQGKRKPNDYARAGKLVTWIDGKPYDKPVKRRKPQVTVEYIDGEWVTRKRLR